MSTITFLTHAERGRLELIAKVREERKLGVDRREIGVSVTARGQATVLVPERCAAALVERGVPFRPPVQGRGLVYHLQVS